MKLTKQQLKQIIREELARTISETDDAVRVHSGPHEPHTAIETKLNEATSIFLAARGEAMKMYNDGDNRGFEVIKQWLGVLNDRMQGHAQYQDATQSSSDQEELES